MRRARSILSLLILLALAIGPAVGNASAQARSEVEVKALFFVALSKYAQWPTNAFADANSPLIIGVLGPDPFGAVLESLTAKEIAGNRPIKVARYATADEAERCHLLYFGQMPPVRMERDLERLKGRPILTVSEIPGFVKSGGMIELFINDENKVRLRASKSALARGKIELSPSLLRLAQIVACIEWLSDPELCIGEPRQVAPKRLLSLAE